MVPKLSDAKRSPKAGSALTRVVHRALVCAGFDLKFVGGKKSTCGAKLDGHASADWFRVIGGVTLSRPAGAEARRSPAQDQAVVYRALARLRHTAGGGDGQIF